MSDKKGFTLIEIIVALVIIALLAAMAIPGYLTSQMQGAAKAAQNNLITIYNAEKTYYLDAVNGGNYCTTSLTPSPQLACAESSASTCAPDLNSINCNLSLSITDPGSVNNDGYFTYSCITDASGFSCTAKNIANTSFTLTVTNNSIVLPGSSGTLNPTCTDVANPAYCPSASN